MGLLCLSLLLFVLFVVLLLLLVFGSHSSAMIVPMIFSGHGSYKDFILDPKTNDCKVKWTKHHWYNNVEIEDFYIYKQSTKLACKQSARLVIHVTRLSLGLLQARPANAVKQSRSCYQKTAMGKAGEKSLKRISGISLALMR